VLPVFEPSALQWSRSPDDRVGIQKSADVLVVSSNVEVGPDRREGVDVPLSVKPRDRSSRLLGRSYLTTSSADAIVPQLRKLPPA